MAVNSISFAHPPLLRAHKWSATVEERMNLVWENHTLGVFISPAFYVPYQARGLITEKTR